MTRSYLTPAERLAEKTRRDPCGCWLFTGVLRPNGYGYMKVGNRKDSGAHRIAWEAANGRVVPEGMVICHRCDVRHCVNPDHLFIGSHGDNMADCHAKGRHIFGERHPLSKLTVEKVMECRALASAASAAGKRNWGIKAHARALGVHPKTLKQAITGERWRWLEPEAQP
jgi:hypothetical protein